MVCIMCPHRGKGIGQYHAPAEIDTGGGGRGKTWDPTPPPKAQTIIAEKKNNFLFCNLKVHELTIGAIQWPLA